MSEVDRLLEEYIREHRAGGEANPRAFMERLAGADREELAELIDAYLERAPTRPWNAEAFEGSAAQRLTESLDRALGGQAGLWPVLLPRLRERAQVLRSNLVERLAEGLGAGQSEEKVAAYYHQMEQGTLDSRGVSDRVLEALGGILDTSAATLRRAGESFGVAAGADEAAQPAFTRFSRRGDVEEAAAGPADVRRIEVADEEWDEVDELFRGAER